MENNNIELKYLKDNSYSTCISDKNNQTRLAGNVYCEALPVQIISEPFTIEIYHFDKYSSHEFIMVKHKQDTFIVLNNFHKDYNSMLNHKLEMRNLIQYSWV